MKSPRSREKILECLEKIPIIQVACDRAAVSRATFYRWKENPEFSRAVKKALEKGEELINDLSESQLISLIKDKKLPAITLWLRHHHPRYRINREFSIDWD